MKKILITGITLMFAGLYIMPASAQRNKSKTFRELVDEQAIHIDSLNASISRLEDEKSAMREASDKLIQRINELEMEAEQLRNDKGDLSQQLEGFYSDNLHLNQSNRILIAFNFLVGILLLISLIFFLRRLGKGKQLTTDQKNIDTEQKVSSGSADVQRTQENNVHVSFEDKLQQLERLGSLKEKGVLTEEEFSTQKRTILD